MVLRLTQEEVLHIQVEDMAKNVIIFGADMGNSAHADNKKKDMLILGKGLTQGLDGTTLITEKLYSIIFTAANKTFCLSLHYNGDNSYLFVDGKEIINFKAEDSEIVPYPLCQENISKDFDSSNAARTGLTGYVYDFSVDYWAIANDKMLDIHKYLMENYNIVSNVWIY